MTTQLSDLTALEQSTGIRAGEFSCGELTQHYLDRTTALDPVVGAFAHLAAEQALVQAAEVDQALARGDSADSDALVGCVAPVKDLDLVAGMPCTFGSRAMADFVAPVDSAFVKRMRAAGLVITGKTSTPEFGFPSYTDNDLGHTARTPWDLERSAGGSSGGAATAVATGLASVAQGSDGGGSIRIPASVTGLVGIKPARGRVSNLPLGESVGELAVVGPLGRTVADAAALLDVLAGSTDADLFGLPNAAPGSFLAAARRDPGPLVIGRFSRPMVVDADVDDECIAAYEEATNVLTDLGHEVRDIERPFTPEAVPAFETVWRVGAAALPLTDSQVDLLTPLTRHLRELGQQYSAADLALAVSVMRRAAAQAIEATSGCDVLLTPTLAQLPAELAGLRLDHDPAEDFENQKRFTPFTAPFNVSGQPAISVPVHHTDRGLPVGVQLVGRPRDEWTIISLAAQMERAVQWHLRMPDLRGPHG